MHSDTLYFFIVNSQPPSTSTLPVMQKQRPSKKMLALVASIVSVLALIGGGVYAYMRMAHSPEKVLGKMMQKLSSIYAYQFSGQLSVAVDDQAQHSAQQNNDGYVTGLAGSLITFNGFRNVKDEASPQQQLTVNLSSQISGFSGEKSLSARSIGRVFYFNVTGLPPIVKTFLGSDINNQWIEINVPELLEQFGLSDLQKKFEELQSENEPSDEEMRTVQNIFDAAAPHLLSVTKTLPSEKIHDVSTYHYALKVDVEVAKKMIDDIIAAVGEEMIGEKNIERYAETLDALQDVTGEIWIDKKEYLPQKVVMYVDVRDSSLLKKGVATLSIDLSQYNVEQSVQVPAGAQSIEEIFADVMQGALSSTTKVANDIADPLQDDDNDGLANQYEEILNTDPYNPDTDGDGYLDGDEARHGYNPLGPGKLRWH